MDPQSNRRKSMLLTNLQRYRKANLQLSDIVSHIQEFAMDINGSKFIIQKLRDAPESRKELVYAELKPAMLSLMKDKYAIFVMQRFYEIATSRQREEIIDFIYLRFVELSYDQNGTRMVQFVIEKSDFNVQLLILPLIKDNVNLFAINRHAHFILLKCFENIANKSALDCIVDEMAGSMVDLCKNPFGSRVIQEIFHNGNGQQCQKILPEIIPQMLTLLSDRHGNFVIKVILIKWPFVITELHQRLLIDSFWELSTDKYASNSTEVFLDNATPAQIEEIFAKLLANDAFLGLCVHRFANYPVQKLIDVLNKGQQMTFYLRLLPHKKYLFKHKGGDRVFKTLLRNLNNDC